MKKYVVLVLAILLTLPASPGFSADDGNPKGTLIDLSVEASKPAPNVLGRATIYVEASGTNSAELAKRVNAAIASALESAKAYEKVKTRSGNTHTYPTYSKEGRISGWRIRSELLSGVARYDGSFRSSGQATGRGYCNRADCAAAGS